MKNNSQKADILHLKITIAAMTKAGMRHTMANAEYPAITNWYNASENRRKSSNTLPPFSLVYVVNLDVICYLA